jgi:hypothetical protein
MVSCVFNILASPWVPLGPNRRWGSRGLELADVETGGVAGGHFGSRQRM